MSTERPSLGPKPRTLKRPSEPFRPTPPFRAALKELRDLKARTSGQSAEAIILQVRKCVEEWPRELGDIWEAVALWAYREQLPINVGKPVLTLFRLLCSGHRAAKLASELTKGYEAICGWDDPNQAAAVIRKLNGPTALMRGEDLKGRLTKGLRRERSADIDAARLGLSRTN